MLIGIVLQTITNKRFSSPTLFLALTWYRARCNIQAEIEEMQEEQRSLFSVKTVSVWQLLLDPKVRWQVLSVVVINIGMQLSGIDAVRLFTFAYDCMKLYYSKIHQLNQHCLGK